MITGYRTLNEQELALINEIKEMGLALDVLCAKVRGHVEGEMVTWEDQPSSVRSILSSTEPLRWASIARTELQQGLMALTRAVAKPTTF